MADPSRPRDPGKGEASDAALTRRPDPVSTGKGHGSPRRATPLSFPPYVSAEIESASSRPHRHVTRSVRRRKEGQDKACFGGGENRSGTFLEKRRERRDSPLIRLPPPSPRKRGEGICRDGFHPSHAQRGKSPLPACGERVRVRGGTVIGRRGRRSRSPPQFTSSSRCRRASLAYRRSGGFGGGLVFRGLAHVLVASGPFAIGSPSVCNLRTAAYIGHNEAAAQAASPPQKGL